MPGLLQQAVMDKSMMPLDVLFARLLIAFALGCWVAMVHYLTCSRARRRGERSFMATLVLLSVLIALVTVVIGDNTARAFSLVGTLAIVRFRTVVEDTSDTAFVIYAVVSGMCVGSDYVLGPIACAPLVLAAAWLFRRPLENQAAAGTLVLRLAAGRPLDDSIEIMLKKRLGTHRLSGLMTARGGSALEATYAVQMPAPDQVFLLINDLSRLEGVQGVELKSG